MICGCQGTGFSVWDVCISSIRNQMKSSPLTVITLHVNDAHILYLQTDPFSLPVAKKCEVSCTTLFLGLFVFQT